MEGFFSGGRKLVLWMSPRFLIHPCGKKEEKEKRGGERRIGEEGRNVSKRKTVRHSIIKRENEYGVLSRVEFTTTVFNGTRGERTVVSRLRVP